MPDPCRAPASATPSRATRAPTTLDVPHPTYSCGTCPRSPSLAPLSVPPTIHARITTRRLWHYHSRSSAHVPTESSHLRCHSPPPALAQQFAHAHAPTLPSLHKTGLEPRGFFLYRARVAGAVARPQERYHFSVSKPCSTHVASFLFWTSVPLWRAHFSLPFAARIATPARTCARAAHAPTTDDERRDVRSAGVADWKTAE